MRMVLPRNGAIIDANRSSSVTSPVSLIPKPSIFLFLSIWAIRSAFASSIYCLIASGSCLNFVCCSLSRGLNILMSRIIGKASAISRKSSAVFIKGYDSKTPSTGSGYEKRSSKGLLFFLLVFFCVGAKREQWDCSLYDCEDERGENKFGNYGNFGNNGSYGSLRSLGSLRIVPMLPKFPTLLNFSSILINSLQLSSTPFPPSLPPSCTPIKKAELTQINSA